MEQRGPDRFGAFALLYMTAFLMEVVQDWDYPALPIAFIALTAVLVFTGPGLLGFLGFLVASTAHFLIFRFPDVANHVNLILLCNAALIGSLGRSAWRVRRGLDADLESAWSVMRVCMALVYFLAGFHKLNLDFFHADVSCAGGIAYSMGRAYTSSLFGLPMPLVLLVVGGCALFGVVRRTRAADPSSRIVLPLVGLAVAAAAPLAVLAALHLTVGIPPVFATVFVLSTAGMVVVWEVLGGLLLLVPRVQAPVLGFSLVMHATLAPLGFVDFGSLAFGLLMLFVPDGVFETWRDHASLRIGALRVQRLHVYFAINVVAITLLEAFRPWPFDRNLVAGLAFLAAASLVAWPVVSRMLVLPWTGVRPWSRGTPAWLLLLPAIMLLHGSTSYLGLRTAGNFSMFSNLRTEGERSNHLLLGGNPLKIWGYQEDVVRFIEIDDERAKAGHKYRPLQGMALPVVEFRKLVRVWSEADMVVPVTLEHDGTVYQSDDIVNDPTWKTERTSLEMWLMDFRAIQPDRPNHCRW